MKETACYTHTAVMNAVKDNDYPTIREMLDNFQFPDDGILDRPIDEGQHDMAMAMLSYASCSAAKRQLNGSVGSLIIQRTAPYSNLFGILKMVVYNHPDAREYRFPGKLRSALDADHFGPDINTIISSMPAKRFVSMAKYATSRRLEALSYYWAMPIAQYVYAHDLLPAGLIFSAIASNLRPPKPEVDELHIGLFDPSQLLGKGIPTKVLASIVASEIMGRHLNDGPRPTPTVPSGMPEELREILSHMPPNVHTVVMGTGLDNEMERTATDNLRKAFAAHGAEVPKELLDFLSGGPSPRG